MTKTQEQKCVRRRKASEGSPGGTGRAVDADAGDFMYVTGDNVIIAAFEVRKASSKPVFLMLTSGLLLNWTSLHQTAKCHFRLPTACGAPC